MTRKEIHLRSILRKKGYTYDAKLKQFSKENWKKVEKNRKTRVHVVIYINFEKDTYTAIFFTDTTFKSVTELEKYYIVYNRVKGDMQELGLTPER